MRVLLITNYFPPQYTGGAEVAAYHLCRGLRQRGIECSILVINNRLMETSDSWYELDDIPVHKVLLTTTARTMFSDIYDNRIYKIVANELRRFKPDIVHIGNASGSTMSPYLASRHLKIPTIVTLHDLWLLCPNNMLYRKGGTLCDPTRGRGHCGQCLRRYDYWGAVPGRRALFAYLTQHVRQFISPSQAIIEMHVMAGYPRPRFRLIHNAIEFSPAPDISTLLHPRLRELLDQRFSGPLITYAGGGVEIKGAEVLLRAIPYMRQYLPHATLAVAGSGEPSYLELFRRYAPWVQEIGRVPFKEMLALYAYSDLVLMPSTYFENSPVVIQQSLYNGVPVVASAFGGIPEMIRDGKTGYLFPVGDSAALAEKIVLHFSRSTVHRRQMRRCCRRTASENYNADQLVQTHIELYREVVT